MNIAVIFAGGSGTRMTNADKPKQFLMVHGKLIIVHTIEKFQKHPEIGGIVVACLADWIPYVQEMKKRYSLDKLGAIGPGGETGQMSIYNGLKAAAEVYGFSSDGKDGQERYDRSDVGNPNINNSDLFNGIHENEKNIVLIHDGVRPLIDEKLISDNIAAVKKYGSAITCTPATETVILVRDDVEGKSESSGGQINTGQSDQDHLKSGSDRNTDHNHVESVPDRSRSRFAKAPQSFFLKDILSVEERAISEGRTDMIDSCTLMKEYGYSLHTVIGPYYNIKITTPEDFIIYRALYDAIENEQL